MQKTSKVTFITTKPPLKKAILVVVLSLLLGGLFLFIPIFLSTGIVYTWHYPPQTWGLVGVGAFFVFVAIYYILTYHQGFPALSIENQGIKFISTKGKSFLLKWRNIKGGGHASNAWGDTFLLLLVDKAAPLRIPLLTGRDKALFQVVDNVNKSWLKKLPFYGKLVPYRVILIRLTWLTQEQEDRLMDALIHQIENFSKSEF